ncbi:hypothetical protein AMATHDRAFT_145250 [Amanita thiersii Skay4041]|uniref:F-box domain-containing protein n=1 Tax=Amanita thiersii Skay4041 TaxID=703135 RepID=A0A2A9NJX0_9AGAR|nr:hypothetical protein AMATHDRAFT_145250 [Amanita thiersii Skay4041]
MSANHVDAETVDADVLISILNILYDEYDYDSLYNCSFVSSAFNELASSFLYRRVVLSPPFNPVLNLRDKGELIEPSLFASACLPKYAPYVEELRISGFLSTRPPPFNTFSTTLLNAVKSFSSLRVVKLTPSTYHEDVFTQTLQILNRVTTLEELTVNASCTDNIRAPLVVQIQGLTRLEIYDPTRAMLQILPEWLDRLSKTLTALHLKDNCGSITPGVLKAFVLPPYQETLRSLSIGLSYSLTHDDVFNFLNNFPQLEELELRYYWQIKAPVVPLSLGRLRRFTVLHARAYAKREVLGLCKWMRKVIAHSPIEDLRVICDRDNDIANYGANIRFDSIIDHLSKKHANTLHFLNLGSTYVGIVGLKSLFSSCLNLEEFHVAAGKDALNVFKQSYGELKHLHKAGIELRNMNRRAIGTEYEKVSTLLENGPPTFRILTINGRTWKVRVRMHKLCNE